MAVQVSDTGGGDFRLPEEGTHMAVCNMVVDLGQQQTNFGVKRQVYLRWELPNERTDDDRPMTIGKTYTASLNEKANLRHDLENWRGKSFSEAELKAFDVDKVLGAPCQVTIRHNTKGERTYANVTGVVAIPKGTPKPEPENALVVYDAANDGQWDDLPDWLQDKIKNQVQVQQGGPEHDEANPPPNDPDDFDDDIPF